MPRTFHLAEVLDDPAVRLKPTCSLCGCNGCLHPVRRAPAPRLAGLHWWAGSWPWRLCPRWARNPNGLSAAALVSAREALESDLAAALPQPTLAAVVVEARSGKAEALRLGPKLLSARLCSSVTGGFAKARAWLLLAWVKECFRELAQAVAALVAPTPESLPVRLLDGSTLCLRPHEDMCRHFSPHRTRRWQVYGCGAWVVVWVCRRAVSERSVAAGRTMLFGALGWLWLGWVSGRGQQELQRFVGSWGGRGGCAARSGGRGAGAVSEAGSVPGVARPARPSVPAAHQTGPEKLVTLGFRAAVSRLPAGGACGCPVLPLIGRRPFHDSQTGLARLCSARVGPGPLSWTGPAGIEMVMDLQRDIHRPGPRPAATLPQSSGLKVSSGRRQNQVERRKLLDSYETFPPRA